MTDPIRTNPSQITGGQNNTPATGHTPAQSSSGASFSDALERASRLRFTNHAQQRIEARSIELDDQHLNRLSSAVDKAEAHGSRESLILMDDLAFIVNVRERTVVTTVDVKKRGDGVFTQIDSVVLADDDEKKTDSADAGAKA